MIRFLVLISAFGLIILGLASCATLNEQQCLTVDWRQLGASDGAAGFPSQRVMRHEKACSKHKLAVDRTAYYPGWQDGIKRYCTPHNGLRQGQLGNFYKNSCPIDLEGPFLTAYRPAKRLYDAEYRLDNLEGKLDYALSQLAMLTHSQDPEALKKLKTLTEDIKTYRLDIRRARLDVDRARFDVQQLLLTKPDLAGRAG